MDENERSKNSMGSIWALMCRFQSVCKVDGGVSDHILLVQSKSWALKEAQGTDMLN